VKITNSAVAVTLSSSVKKSKRDEVEHQADNSDVQQRVWIANSRIACRQPLNRFDGDGETQRQKEHGVHQRTEDLGSHPTVRILWRLLFRYLRQTAQIP